MMDSLFAKIDAITVIATALPEDDQAAVDRLTDQLRERLADLEAAKATLEHLQTDSAWLKEKTQNLHNDLTKTRAEARQGHIEAIVGYFNHGHDLGLRVPYQWGEQTEHLEDAQLAPQVAPPRAWRSSVPSPTPTTQSSTPARKPSATPPGGH